MDNVRIQGATHTMGGEGLLELTVRQSMIEFHPYGTVMQNESAWLPNEEERLAIAAGCPIILIVLGNQPPVGMRVEFGSQEPNNRAKPQGDDDGRE